MVRGHIVSHFPKREIEEFEWREGPILDSVPTFRVARVAPGGANEPWTYISLGASQIRVARGHRLEFFMTAPYKDAIHVRTLAMLANYHADPETKELCEGRVLDIGFPWIDGSTCDHFLISPPYLIGPSFEWLLSGSLHIQFLWLLPITRSEAAYARSNSTEELEDIFEQRSIDTLNPFRESVV